MTVSLFTTTIQDRILQELKEEPCQDESAQMYLALFLYFRKINSLKDSDIKNVYRIYTYERRQPPMWFREVCPNKL